MGAVEEMAVEVEDGENYSDLQLLKIRVELKSLNKEPFLGYNG